MTREDIVNSLAYKTTDAAIQYCRKNHPHYDGDIMGDITDTFEAGAEWADEHPKEGMISLDKVVKYLEQYHTGVRGKEFIEDFINAME